MALYAKIKTMSTMDDKDQEEDKDDKGDDDLDLSFTQSSIQEAFTDTLLSPSSNNMRTLTIPSPRSLQKSKTRIQLTQLNRQISRQYGVDKVIITSELENYLHEEDMNDGDTIRDDIHDKKWLYFNTFIG